MTGKETRRDCIFDRDHRPLSSVIGDYRRLSPVIALGESLKGRLPQAVCLWEPDDRYLSARDEAGYGRSANRALAFDDRSAVGGLGDNSVLDLPFGLALRINTVSFKIHVISSYPQLALFR